MLSWQTCGALGAAGLSLLIASAAVAGSGGAEPVDASATRLEGGGYSAIVLPGEALHGQVAGGAYSATIGLDLSLLESSTAKDVLFGDGFEPTGNP